MGSSLSGRRSDKPLVEDCLTLDIAWLIGLGPIAAGTAGDGEVAWSIDGTLIASAKFRLDLRMIDAPSLNLTFCISQADGQNREISQKIALTSTAQNFGGSRWWLRCPVTDARVRKLYMPPIADHFASRNAYSLGYRVERLNHFDRPFEKLFRAQRKLGCEQGLALGLTRPKGMWQRTFARRLENFADLDANCGKVIVALIGRAG